MELEKGELGSGYIKNVVDGEQLTFLSTFTV
jgi:hypothetical protein